MNFDNIEEEIRNRINNEVSIQTDNRVKDLVTKDDANKLKSDSPLAVVMGNYFKVRF